MAQITTYYRYTDDSPSYVQELEARLMHMEEVFKQVAPIVEVIGKSPNGVPLENIVEVVQKQKDVAPLRPPQQQHQQQQQTNPLTFRDRTASEQSNSPSPRSPSAKSSREEDEVSESFGQLALDEHGHLRWIGGSSTMTLIQSFRTLTTSPLHRISPMEEDPHSPAPSANKLYFPASVYFGKVRALPGPEEVEYPARDLADKLVRPNFSQQPDVCVSNMLCFSRSMLISLGYISCCQPLINLLSCPLTRT